MISVSQFLRVIEERSFRPSIRRTSPHFLRGCVNESLDASRGGWNVTGLFGNFYQANVPGMAGWTSAYWEIRTGMSEGNGGTVLYGGAGSVVAATQTPTGNSAVGQGATFQEYLAILSVPEFYLAPGEYWLGIAPIVIHDATGGYVGAYASATDTDALGGIKSQTDNVSIGWINNNWDYRVLENDWSYGVLGYLAENGPPGDGEPGEEDPNTPTYPVPEPATMTLIAAGALLLLRRRQRLC